MDRKQAFYEALVINFFDQVKVWLRQRDIPEAELDDARQELFVKFLTLDVFGRYNPGKAQLSTFVKSITMTCALGIRDQNRRREFREPLWADAPVLHNDETTSWIESHGAPEVPDLSPIEMALEHDRMRAMLRGKTEWGHDLVQVYDAMVAEVEETGELGRARLAARLGLEIRRGGNAGKPAKATAALLVNAVKAELVEANFMDVFAA